MKILIILIFQLATQYGVYNKYTSNQEHIGNITIQKETLNLHMTGYKVDSFKIVFKQSNFNSETYYVENENMKGFVMFIGAEIRIEIVLKNKTVVYKKFYRKWQTRI